MRSWWGEWLSATSTYWGGVEKPSATYGVYASNVFGGPGVFNHTYASNMSDSGVYIGACPDCNTIVENSQFEGNDLGYSGSNSGGHLTIANTEFNNNEEGVATTSQNNDDAPPPQDGLCPEGKENPSPPPGAQRNNICWVMIHSRIIENNNGGTPTSGGAPGLLGTGMPAWRTLSAVLAPVMVAITAAGSTGSSISSSRSSPRRSIAARSR